MNHDELSSLYNFLLHTGEANLRQMMVDGKNMTDAHLRLLLKIVRACPEPQFLGHIEKGDFPKIKMSAGEIVLKERFWGVCISAFQSRGLLTAAPAAKAA